MGWKWIARIALVAVVYYAADAYSSSRVLARITEYRETLIAPDGRRFEVARPEGRPVPQAGRPRPGEARIAAVEGVSFGYRVTYALATRPGLACTYRLPGVSCEDGWRVVWRPRGGR